MSNDAPKSGGTKATAAASATTTGVYLLAKRSTILSAGARCACASSTMWTILAMVVSEAAAVARTRSVPPSMIEPAKTWSPGPLATGADSPVTGAWSAAAAPSMTTPSTAARSPGRIRTTSPTTMSATSSVFSSSSPSSSHGRSTVAVGGASFMRPLMARRVRSSVATCNTVPRLKRKATSAASDHSPMAAAPIMASVMSTFMSTCRPRRLNTAARATYTPPLSMAAPKSHGAASGAAAVATKPATVSAPDTRVAMARGSESQKPRPAGAAASRRALGLSSAARRSTVSYPSRRTARKTSGRAVSEGSMAIARVAAPKLTSALRTPRSRRSAPCSFTAQSAQSMPVTWRMRRSPCSSAASGRERSSGPCSCTASGQWSAQWACAPARRAKVSTSSPVTAASS